MRYLHALLGVILFCCGVAWIVDEAALVNCSITDGEFLLACAIVFAGGLASGK